MQKLLEVLEVLDKANLQLRADEYKIACTKSEWLRNQLSGKSISPVNESPND